jgi:hypothetical protein
MSDRHDGARRRQDRDYKFAGLRSSRIARGYGLHVLGRAVVSPHSSARSARARSVFTRALFAYRQASHNARVRYLAFWRFGAVRNGSWAHRAKMRWQMPCNRRQLIVPAGRIASVFGFYFKPRPLFY